MSKILTLQIKSLTQQDYDSEQSTISDTVKIQFQDGNYELIQHGIPLIIRDNDRIILDKLLIAFQINSEAGDPTPPPKITTAPDYLNNLESSLSTQTETTENSASHHALLNALSDNEDPLDFLYNSSPIKKEFLDYETDLNNTNSLEKCTPLPLLNQYFDAPIAHPSPIETVYTNPLEISEGNILRDLDLASDETKVFRKWK